MKYAARGTAHRWAALGILFFGASACERKAPSPDECVDYAMVRLRVNDQRFLSPEGKDKLDTLVVQCLTTPFDKELIACTKRRPGSSSCFLEFQERDRRRNTARD